MFGAPRFSRAASLGLIWRAACMWAGGVQCGGGGVGAVVVRCAAGMSACAPQRQPNYALLVISPLLRMGACAHTPASCLLLACLREVV
jgi:hypothetical protein